VSHHAPPHFMHLLRSLYKVERLNTNCLITQQIKIFKGLLLHTGDKTI
jgi:hypothetical protein